MDIIGITHFQNCFPRYSVWVFEAVPGYTLFGAWSGVNLMAAQGAYGTDFYDRSTKTIGTMLWTEYRPVLKSVPKAPWAAMRSAQFTPPQAPDRV